MNIKIYIENQLIDLNQGQNITLQLNSNIFGTIDKIQTSRSYTITAPFTDNNRTIFEHIELPSRTSSFMKAAKNATVFVDGLLIFEGKVVLLSISSSGYEIALNFGELTELASIIADDRKLSELGFTESWKEWIKTTPLTTTKEDIALYDYNYGIAFNPDKAQRSYCVRFLHILEQIESFYGINFNLLVNGNPYLNNYMSSRYLLLTKNLNEHKEEYPYLEYRTNFNAFTLNYISKNDLGNAFRVADTNLMYSRVGMFVMDLNKISQIKFTITFNATTAYRVYLRRFTGAVKKYEYLLNQSTTNVIYIDSSTISVNDYFNISGDSNGADTTTIVEVVLSNGESYPLSDVLVYKRIIPATGVVFPEMEFPIYKNLDFTALEFLKQCQLLFGFYFSQGTAKNVFNLNSFNDILDKTNAVDYSNQFISLQSSEFVFGEWAKQNVFKYKESDEEINTDYNSSIFELDNILLPLLLEYISSFGTGTLDTPMRVNQYSILDPTTPDIAIVPSLNSIPYTFAKRNSSYQLEAVPFSEILNERYSVLISTLENLRVCEINLNLTPLEFKNFNIQNSFYIKQLGKYFIGATADYDFNTNFLKIKAVLI